MRLLIDKLVSQIKEAEEKCSSVEAGKRAGMQVLCDFVINRANQP